MPNDDRAFHDSFRPNWTSNGTLVFASTGKRNNTALVKVMTPVSSEPQDIHFASLSSDAEVSICSVSVLPQKLTMSSPL